MRIDKLKHGFLIEDLQLLSEIKNHQKVRNLNVDIFDESGA